MSDEDANAFSKQQENADTKWKTLHDLKIFREFLESWDEARETEDITPVELLKNKHEGIFVLAVNIFLLKSASHSLPYIILTLVIVVTQTTHGLFLTAEFLS